MTYNFSHAVSTTTTTTTKHVIVPKKLHQFIKYRKGKNNL